VTLLGPKAAAGQPFSDVTAIDIIGIHGATYGVPFGGRASLLGSFRGAQGDRKLVLEVPSWQVSDRDRRKLAPDDKLRLAVRIVSWGPAEIQFIAPTAQELGVGDYKILPPVHGDLVIFVDVTAANGTGRTGSTPHWPVLAGVPELQIGFDHSDMDHDGHWNRAVGGDDCDDLDGIDFQATSKFPTKTITTRTVTRQRTGASTRMATGFATVEPTTRTPTAIATKATTVTTIWQRTSRPGGNVQWPR
jgi:hypothetical protein